MEKVTILDKTLEADFTNPDFMASYEDALAELGASARNLNLQGRASEGARNLCNSVIQTFDSLFGSGTARQVLGKETNLLVCLDAVADLAGIYDDQITPIIEEKAKKAKEKLAMRKKNEKV